MNSNSVSKKISLSAHSFYSNNFLISISSENQLIKFRFIRTNLALIIVQQYQEGEEERDAKTGPRPLFDVFPLSFL